MIYNGESLAIELVESSFRVKAHILDLTPSVDTALGSADTLHEGGCILVLADLLRDERPVWVYS